MQGKLHFKKSDLGKRQQKLEWTIATDFEDSHIGIICPSHLDFRKEGWPPVPAMTLDTPQIGMRLKSVSEGR